MSSLEKFDNLQKRINGLKENIKSSFNANLKVSDINKHSEDYVALTKEKYKLYIIID